MKSSTGRYLVTTANEKTWPVDEPLIFLGEWCRLYNRKHLWEEMDSLVAPYHWDERQKLQKDYQHLSAIFEQLLSELSSKLNEIHNTDHSLRYWRIIIGPWLGFFIQIIFDRWTMIQLSLSKYEISGVLILENYLDGNIVPNDMRHFHSLYGSDRWNEAIYGHLLKNFTNTPVKLIPKDETNEFLEGSEEKIEPGNLSRREKFQKILVRSAQTILGLLTRGFIIYH